MSVAVPAIAPGPAEGCPPPLRCREVWRNVHDTADVWERTTARGATFVAVGVDLTLLARAATELAARYR